MDIHIFRGWDCHRKSLQQPFFGPQLTVGYDLAQWTCPYLGDHAEKSMDLRYPAYARKTNWWPGWWMCDLPIISIISVFFCSRWTSCYAELRTNPTCPSRLWATRAMNSWGSLFVNHQPFIMTQINSNHGIDPNFRNRFRSPSIGDGPMVHAGPRFPETDRVHPTASCGSWSCSREQNLRSSAAVVRSLLQKMRFPVVLVFFFEFLFRDCNHYSKQAKMIIMSF